MVSGFRRNDDEAIWAVRSGVASSLISLNISAKKVGIYQGTNPNIAIYA
jgi:hypothetical protein